MSLAKKSEKLILKNRRNFGLNFSTRKKSQNLNSELLGSLSTVKNHNFLVKLNEPFLRALLLTDSVQ